MLDLLEAGIDSDSWDIFSELAAPCFEASAQHMEVAESRFCLHLHFECYASGPLVQQDLQAKQVLEIVQSFNLVFSSDRSGDRFTGKPVSQTTGLYYEYQRWYDPTIGRFISQDPLAGHLSNPQSLNPYVYVQNTPTTYADPSGMSIASPNLHGSNCPAIWQASFWSNPLGSIGCSFGFGPSGTVIGGGAGGAGEAGGPILGWGLFGIWAGVEIYSNWGTITTDWGNLWGTSQTGRAGTDNGGGGSNGGETTTTPRIAGGTGSTTILPNVGGSVWSTGTPSINMGKGPPDRNPDYDWTKFPGRQPPRPTPTIRGEFSSRRIPRPVCGALALSVGIGVTAFASQLVNEQTTERGGGTGAALVALFFGTTGGTYALCATL